MTTFGPDPVDGMEREWERLRRRPAALAHASRWRLLDEPLDDLQQFIDTTSGDASPHTSERLLRSLMTLAESDDLAGRIVLQRLWPDLVAVHRRRRRTGWSGAREVGLGDLLATGWTVIRTFNHDRRPMRLVNSLVSDVEYREYRARFRRVAQPMPTDPVGFQELAGSGATDPTVELAELVSDPRCGLTDADRELLARLMNGARSSEIARDLGVTTRTVRNRRARLTLRLREVALAA